MVAIEVLGSGSDLVLLHGWGMNSAIWQGIAPELSRHYRLHLVDLPGFGDSAAVSTQQEYSPQWLSEVLLPQLPERFALLGWSLGGMFALHLAAEHPERVSQLITVGSSPAFLANGDWPGVQPKVLRQFQNALAEDFRLTIDRFLAIQSLGSPQAKSDLRQVRDWLAAKPLPDLHALKEGLCLLEELDLRPLLPQIICPWLRLYGARDSLTPLPLKALLDERYPQSQSHIFAQSAHLPFISEQAEFLLLLNQFLAAE